MDKQKVGAILFPLSAEGKSTYNLPSLFTWQFPLASNADLPSIAFAFTQDKMGLPVGAELIARDHGEEMLFMLLEAWGNFLPTYNSPVFPKEEKVITRSFPKYNGLITRLGTESYKQVLRKKGGEALTPEKFKGIYQHVLTQFQRSNHN